MNQEQPNNDRKRTRIDPSYPTPSEGSGGCPKSSEKYKLDDNCVRATIAAGGWGAEWGVGGCWPPISVGRGRQLFDAGLDDNYDRRCLG